ncbi:MAG: molybdenum cofactor biosynthesis protein MoaE [Flavobacteriia bacterium]|nr:molybdenum cofactor biosynthesis protein MoaE [Flavobacteriia bacterium]
MENNTIKYKNCFKPGAIIPDFIADSIAKHQSKIGIGAHQIFLGQVREDEIDGKKVQAIEYSAYEEMANKVFHEIREEAYSKFELTCMHIYHSIGVVKKGEICLFVFVSSKHRKSALQAIEYVVEEIKLKAPVFGKEIFENQEYVWKENKFD